MFYGLIWGLIGIGLAITGFPAAIFLILFSVGLTVLFSCED